MLYDSNKAQLNCTEIKRGGGRETEGAGERERREERGENETRERGEETEGRETERIRGGSEKRRNWRLRQPFFLISPLH